MRLLIAFLVFMSCPFLYGQSLMVNNTGANSDPVALVANYLAGGGMSVFNVTFSGINNQQIGYYSSGSSALGSASGVVISTGNVLDADNLNTSTSTGTNLGASSPTDGDIAMLTGSQPASDWFILEFDFIPEGNEIHLQYIFASEEYQDYVCSNQADEFAVLISGPGFAGTFSGGGELVSVIPSTSNAVGINSVNNGVPGVFGSSGSCVGSGASPYYNANTDSLMEFNGFTDLMSISASVECKEQYHMRIILFDRGAKNFDSGIFLAEKSLTSNGSGVYNNAVYQDSILVEGCKPFEYVIYNVTGFTGETINLSIGGTAQNGIDYATIANPMVLPAGDEFYVITINPINDGVSEGTETVTVSFEMINLCGDTIPIEFTLYIQDQNPITVGSFPTDLTTCAGDPVTLLAGTIAGGIGPYVINWNGLPGNNITVAPTETTTYTCEIYDQAGCPYYNNFTVTVYPVPVVNAGPDFNICAKQVQNLGLVIDGGPNATYLWQPSFQLNATDVPYPTLTAGSTQTYYVTVTNPGGCTKKDTVKVTVLPLPTVDAGEDQTVVYLQTSATLEGAGSGTPIWSPDYFLSCLACYEPDASPRQTTTYTLTMIGANGCTASDDVVVEVEVPTEVFVPSAFSPNGDGNNDILFLRCYTAAAMQFTVYDMWGQQLFYTDNPSIGWDGKVNGMAANIGLYTWTANVTFVNNAGQVQMAGEVNLVK